MNEKTKIKLTLTNFIFSSKLGDFNKTTKAKLEILIEWLDLYHR